MNTLLKSPKSEQILQISCCGNSVLLICWLYFILWYLLLPYSNLFILPLHLFPTSIFISSFFHLLLTDLIHLSTFLYGNVYCYVCIYPWYHHTLWTFCLYQQNVQSTTLIINMLSKLSSSETKESESKKNYPWSKDFCPSESLHGYRS